MPRNRTLEITESVAVLRDIEDGLHSDRTRLGVRILRILREHSFASIEEIATTSSTSERNVYRVMKIYQEEGIQGVILQGDGGSARSRSWLEDLAELSLRAIQRQFSDLEEARRWFCDCRGERFSRSEIGYLLRSFGQELKGIGPSDSGVPLRESEQAALMRLINTLPITDQTDQWIEEFRARLHGILPDVDRIVMNIRTSCNLREPEADASHLILRQHISEDESGYVSLTPYRQEGRPSEQLLRELGNQGRSLESYYPPISINYYIHETAYLGTLFLFRERSATPISAPSIALIESLESFIIYAIVSHVAWVQHEGPQRGFFQEVTSTITHDARLSLQEQRVLVYHLLGYSYDEMAEFLSLSSKTIKTHVSAIHRKAGIRTHRELIAKYLTPRLRFAHRDTSE